MLFSISKSIWDILSPLNYRRCWWHVVLSHFLSIFSMLVFGLLELAMLHFFLFQFPMLGNSVACSHIPAIQLPFLVTVGSKTWLLTSFITNHIFPWSWMSLHLFMLTMAVFPAFFNTWSHSSSSPRILYLKVQKKMTTSMNIAMIPKYP